MHERPGEGVEGRLDVLREIVGDPGRVDEEDGDGHDEEAQEARFADAGAAGFEDGIEGAAVQADAVEDEGWRI